MKKPDLEAPLSFLKIICGDEKPAHITVIHPKTKKVRDFQITLNPKEMDRLWSYNKLGFGIYFTPNETDDTGKRGSKNIVSVRALFVDLDNTDLDNLDMVRQMSPAPSIAVRTSKGKYHCYWLVDDCPLGCFKQAQQTQSKKYNGDPSVCDLPRLMRVAGFYHTKDKPFLSHVLEESQWAKQ